MLDKEVIDLIRADKAAREAALRNGKAPAAPKQPGGSGCKPCERWDDLVLRWRKAMKWPASGEGLDKALSVMLACAASTRFIGDQLWCKILSPASSGKSELCEALAVNKDHVVAKSKIKRLFSGYRSDQAGKEDNSLIKEIQDKVLVVKDGDTLLTMPNLSEILSELRDLYDRTSRTYYGNQMGRNYEGINMTFLLCGTQSLRSIDSSELGERFLDCIIVDGMNHDLEDEIGWRVANTADRETSCEVDGTPESRDTPEKAEAKAMTGGYLGWLRQNAARLIKQVECSETALRKCQRLATFVSYLRARPAKKQREKDEKELSFRLIKQHVKLAKFLAVVLNKSCLDADVMRRVRAVALDTARGRTFELCKHLMREGPMEGHALSIATCEPAAEEGKYLHFMRRIGALTTVDGKKKGQGRRWKMSPRLEELWREAVDEEVR